MIFAVFSASRPDLLRAAIETRYSGDSSIQLREGQWLVVDQGISAQGVSEKLGIGSEPGTVGSALVVGLSGYHGRQPANVWDWMKAKLEAK